ncbi:hypothetical protein CGRA01v4_12190 [Colletotrichum graminicola]|nr:hypothetical protein CGRA01v4_12190 [Colletotrichum graminicola]
MPSSLGTVPGKYFFIERGAGTCAGAPHRTDPRDHNSAPGYTGLV